MNKYREFMSEIETKAISGKKSINTILKNTFSSNDQVHFLELLVESELVSLNNDAMVDYDEVMWMQLFKKALSNFRKGGVVSGNNASRWVAEMAELKSSSNSNSNLDRFKRSYYYSNNVRITGGYNNDGVLSISCSSIVDTVVGPIWYVDSDTPLDKYLVAATLILSQLIELGCQDIDSLKVLINKIEVIKLLKKNQSKMSTVQPIRVLTKSPVDGSEGCSIDEYEKCVKRTRKKTRDGVIEYICEEVA